MNEITYRQFLLQGFSRYMSLPALQVSRITIACQWSGIAQATASISP